MIKTFRGLLADGTQDRIRLSTLKGKVGYRITKFEVMHDEPGQQHVEGTMKIYKTSQSTIDNNVDFSDPNLLAAAYLAESDDHANTIGMVTIFDSEIFNQDIYVTLEDTVGSRPMNYYIEVEVKALSDMQAEYTTIKDIRSNS
tara:strand:+ start:132 stop:560 length:429 start_codon:yes stop_codon:yes gene_type:complete